VLIDDAATPDAACYLFSEPLEVIQCHDPDGVAEALGKIEAAQAKGLYGAGFLSYELGYRLEPKLRPLLPPDRKTPLVWMGIFGEPREIASSEIGRLLDPGRETFQLSDLAPSMLKEAYFEAIEVIRNYIADGEVYQINYTFPYRFHLSGSIAALFARLRRKQRAGFGALIAAEDFHVLSLSPELFFEVENGTARARPMKGTAARAFTPEADIERRNWLREDEKSRAENLMIVDLVRNDLGRVAETGSVAVTDLFTVETYPTLHQMTSGVEANVRKGAGFRDLIAALFPCGSVTGAPKVRAMEIIREMEAEPRGVYTGAVGMVSPDGGARFNVAIRTLVVDGQGRGEMGVGGGIVFDSDAEAEYDECLLKARFLTDSLADTIEPFRLIETLRLEDGAYTLLDRHILRLEHSAASFAFTVDSLEVRRALAETAKGLNGGLHRVRLLVDENGEMEISSDAMVTEPGESTISFEIWNEPTDRESPFTYHKTTRREFYDRARDTSSCDEVVFFNDRGEVTEGSITNVFVERGGRLLTPPVACGLLPGTLRWKLLDEGER